MERQSPYFSNIEYNQYHSDSQLENKFTLSEILNSSIFIILWQTEI